MQSRAAARLRLQKIGEVGKGSSECICFPIQAGGKIILRLKDGTLLEAVG